MCIWFWQRIVTPHMAELVSELAQLGCDVTYIAEEPMSSHRAEQGWVAPSMQGVTLKFVSSTCKHADLVALAPDDSTHICQGMRGNGLIGRAQSLLYARRLRQWVVMEAVADSGWRGALKRFEYRRLFSIWRQRNIRGVLAIGQSTSRWVVNRGMPAEQVYPFSYFLKDLELIKPIKKSMKDPFRFIFVGQLIERKRLELLLAALHSISHLDFLLLVVGSGKLETQLKSKSKKLLPGRVQWAGRLKIKKIPFEMARADCLVLPSRYDGWGAVASEALMVGTPVICSDTCGSAGVVQASRKGGVFKSGDHLDLVSSLKKAVNGGRVKNLERAALSDWARCLGAKMGAAYLFEILQYDNNVTTVKPIPPWFDADRRSKNSEVT